MKTNLFSPVRFKVAGSLFSSTIVEITGNFFSVHKISGFSRNSQAIRISDIDLVEKRSHSLFSTKLRIVSKLGEFTFKLKNSEADSLYKSMLSNEHTKSHNA